MASLLTRKWERLQEPRFLQKLFNDPRASLFWLPLRLWLGYKWIEAALPKIIDPRWMNTGEALKTFWLNAVKIPEQGRPPIAFDWYRSFLQFLLNTQSYTWFAKLVACGELLVGIALILGAFTGIAAFFGSFMNWNYMMAGSASINPMLFVIAIGLTLAWKISGRLGADAVLLSLLDKYWQRLQQRLPRVEVGARPALPETSQG